MKKLIFFSIIFVCLLIFILPAILVFGIKYLPSGTQPSLGNTKKIYQDFSLSQSFISMQNNLGGIGVSIKNPNFANKKNATFQLSDNEKRTLRYVILNGQNIADGKFVKILFEPISDSKGKEYTWVLSSPESVFEDALEIFLTDNPPLWSLDAKEVLSYVTLHKVTNPFEVLAKILSEWINNLVHDRTFFVIYVLLLSGLTAALLYLNFSKK